MNSAKISSFESKRKNILRHCIVDRKTLKENRFITPFTYIKPKTDKKNITYFYDVVRIIIENVRELELHNYVHFFISHSGIKWRSNYQIMFAWKYLIAMVPRSYAFSSKMLMSSSLKRSRSLKSTPS